MNGKNIRLDIALITDAAVRGFKKKYYQLGPQFHLLAYFVYTLIRGRDGLEGEIPHGVVLGKMSVFFIKLADRSSNVLLQAILGTYGHLMWVRTEIPEEMIVKVITTPELASETRGVLEALRGEIEFEFVDPPGNGDLPEDQGFHGSKTGP